MADVLLLLVITHLVSDFLLQPGKWGNDKINNFKFRLFHCIQYSLLFLVVFYFLGINLLWGVWVFTTHFLIDDYKLVNWWNSEIRARGVKTPSWMSVIQDQILHVLVLLPIVFF